MNLKGFRRYLTVFMCLLLIIPLAALSQDKEKAPSQDDLLADVSLSAFKLWAIGPAVTSGRISDFAVNPEDPGEYYVATSSGGVWKTTNAGTTFSPILDSQGSYSIGCVTMDPNNHHVIWVGTGEKKLEEIGAPYTPGRIPEWKK